MVKHEVTARDGTKHGNFYGSDIMRARAHERFAALRQRRWMFTSLPRLVSVYP